MTPYRQNPRAPEERPDEHLDLDAAASIVLSIICAISYVAAVVAMLVRR